MLATLWEILSPLNGKVVFTKAVLEAETAFDIFSLGSWSQRGNFVSRLSFENALILQYSYDKDSLFEGAEKPCKKELQEMELPALFSSQVQEGLEVSPLWLTELSISLPGFLTEDTKEEPMVLTTDIPIFSHFSGLSASFTALPFHAGGPNLMENSS